MYKVVLDLGAEFNDDIVNPSFFFEDWNEMQGFVDICLKNQHVVKIESVE